MPHLPMNRAEMTLYGWDTIDFLLVSGDAYIDHPSFGSALIARVLADAGWRVGIIAQPDPAQADSLLDMGRPRLGVLLAPGVVDSMVNHYTSAKRKRSTDAYSPGGQTGLRPDRALIRYGQMVRSQIGRIPLIAGGAEATLRRLAHYDYWSDQVRYSVLMDSAADMLVYGEGEGTILEIASYLEQGIDVRRLNTLRGTVVLMGLDQLPRSCQSFLVQHAGWQPDLAGLSDRAHCGSILPENDQFVLLPSATAVMHDPVAYALACRYQEQNQDPVSGKTLIQAHDSRYLVQNPPRRPLSQQELDHVYGLPFERSPHPRYTSMGKIPAAEEISFSITAHRGCYGGCHFCAVNQVQGRVVRPRSDTSIVAEARQLTAMPDFKGIIHDVGGPTANFHEPACNRQESGTACRDRACLTPEPCRHLRTGTGNYLKLLQQIRSLPGVRKVFVRSGIRHDVLMLDQNDTFLTELCLHHISGQLKIAPEHISDGALAAMGKPSAESYRAFSARYCKMNENLGKRQYLVPYLMSGHPGCTLNDAVDLACYLRREKINPEQVQDFYPTPGTLSTAMYWTGINPLTMQPVHVPDAREKRLQRALLQPFLPANRQDVLEALRLTGRMEEAGILLPFPVRPHQTSGVKPASRNGCRRQATRQKNASRQRRSPAGHKQQEGHQHKNQGGI